MNVRTKSQPLPFGAHEKAAVRHDPVVRRDGLRASACAIARPPCCLGTADLALTDGEETSGTRFALGARVWF